MTTNIAIMRPEDSEAWDRYVERRSDGSFFHLSGWGRAIRAVYGYEPLYLAARRGGEIAGVLPLIDVRSPLLGRSLVSTAFTVGGGPIGDDDETVNALADAAARLGKERGVQFVELRGDAAPAGWEIKTGRHAVFRMTIPADETENFNAVPRKRRAELRKATAAQAAGDLRIRYETDIDAFYALYRRSMRELGTPVFPKRFIREVIRAFPETAEIAFADYKGKPVAALVSFYFKDSVLPYYVGAEKAAREARAFDFLYWSVMRRAAARDCNVFDFGRSKIGSGAYHYKKLWGIEPQPLAYQYRLIAAHAAPDVSPNNPKFRSFSKLWTRLPPPAANALGPLLAPNFP